MKKQILMMALCVSTLMPVTVFGEEAAVQNVSTVNKEETASGDENPKIEESEVTAVNDTVTVAIDADILDYPGKKEGNIIGEVLEGDEISRTGTISDAWSRILFEDETGKNTDRLHSYLLSGRLWREFRYRGECRGWRDT